MLTLAPWRRHQLRDRSLTQQTAGLVEARIEEFRRAPDEWKDIVIQQVQLFRRMSENPLAPRFIGEEDDSEDN